MSAPRVMLMSDAGDNWDASFDAEPKSNILSDCN